jgi:flagellin-like hook-associated protein FlgL
MPSAVRPGHFTRVSMNMQTNQLLNNIRSNSVDLLMAQDQISSGLRIARPSDAPSEATTVMSLDNTMERFEQFIKNMGYANDTLASTDFALGQSVTLLTDAISLAKKDSDPAGMATDSGQINGILNALVSVANTQARGNFIFAGQNGTQAPFTASNSGILYTGSTDEMRTRVSLDNQIDFSIDGSDVFGALSSQVIGIADMNPDMTANTMLSDLNGAMGAGIRLGSIRILDGAGPSVVIDLSKAATVGDVISKINIDGGGVTATLGADGSSFTITGVTGLTISEVGTGKTAGDLGIIATAAGATVSGQDVDARLSLATPVTALAGGAGIDTTSGLLLTNSGISGIGPIDLSAATTIQDVLNTINTSGLAVRAVINDAGDGINIFNQLSGSELRIGENGGTTAADLGIRSMVATTALADMNGGLGVHVVGQGGTAGVIQITDHFGNAKDVDLSSATTVQDVIALINTAPGAAVTASLATTGNGIVLTDGTGIAGTLTIETISTNGYKVAEELGFASGNSSTTNATLTGTDVNAAMPDGVFSNLIALRDAMKAGDRDEVLRVAKLLDEVHLKRLINYHGQVGSQVAVLEDRQERLEANMAAIVTLRSDLVDVDMAEAITKYQNIFTALQANLMSAGQMSNTSLLDFLR